MLNWLLHRFPRASAHAISDAVVSIYGGGGIRPRLSVASAPSAWPRPRGFARPHARETTLRASNPHASKVTPQRHPERNALERRTSHHTQGDPSSPRAPLDDTTCRFARSPPTLHFISLRRGRDSNPRYLCRYTGFRDLLLQPLGHPSTLLLILRSPRSDPPREASSRRRYRQIATRRSVPPRATDVRRRGAPRQQCAR